MSHRATGVSLGPLARPVHIRSDMRLFNYRPNLAALPLVVALAACTAAEVTTGTVEQAALDEAPYKASFIWNGFNHAWDYNHRINRLGDWTKTTQVDSDVYQGELLHTGASGVGADTAHYDSNYTFVSADAVFWHGSRVITLDSDRENTFFDMTHHITVPVDRTQNTVLLRGFDLTTVDGSEAMMAEHFNIAVSDEQTTDAGFTFKLVVRAQFDCDTPECAVLGIGINRPNYALTVFYTVVSADPGVMAVTAPADPIDNAYVWDDCSDLLSGDFWDDACDELHLEDDGRLHREIDGYGGGDFSAAALGFKSLGVSLDKAHHMVQTAWAIQPGTYDADEGQHAFTLDLFFKHWGAGDTTKPTSYRSAGSASVWAKVALLQFDEGTTDSGSESGSISWEPNWPWYVPAAEDQVAEKIDGASLLYDVSTTIADLELVEVWVSDPYTTDRREITQGMVIEVMASRRVPHSARIVNNSASVATPKTTLFVTSDLGEQRYAIPALGPGASTIVDFHVNVPVALIDDSVKEAVALRVEVGASDFDDPKPDNNAWQTIIGDGYFRPDLSPEIECEETRRAVALGSDATCVYVVVTGTARNGGAEPVGGSSELRLRLDNVGLQTLTVRDLAAGERTSAVFDEVELCFGEDSRKVLELVADPTGAVGESDENNNTATCAFTK